MFILKIEAGIKEVCCFKRVMCAIQLQQIYGGEKKVSVSSKLSGAAKPTSLGDEEYRGLKQRTMAYNGDGTLVLMQHLPIVIL